MWSHEDGCLSAATQVKVLSPEITLVALGQGFHFLEARNEACATGKCVLVVPGSESAAGKRTVYIGTWEDRSIPNRSSYEAEEVDKEYGVSVVGPLHTRGVGRVMPTENISSLEGSGGLSQRDEV